MGIINTGVFDTEDIFKRATGNDWPVAEAIVATGGGGTDLTGNTTTDLAEGANLYFTNARVVAALVAGDNIVIEANGRISSTATGEVSGIDLSANTTTDLAEGDNLYYTNARVQSYLEENNYQTADSILANVTFGMDLSGNTTTDLAEGDNLYYTNTRVQAYLDEQGYSTGSAGTDLSGNTTTDLAEGDNLYYTNARAIAALTSATIGGNVTVEGTVAANSFTSTGFGIPTITAETNIVLSANGYNGSSVVIQNSPLRIRSYAEANLSSLTPGTGDLVFNSTIQQLQVYTGAAWANVGGGISSLGDFTTDDLNEGTANLYFSNTRVVEALVAGDNIIIESNGRISANLESVASIDLGSVSANILPTDTETYNLGSPDKKWKDLYLSGNTLILGDTSLSAEGGELVVGTIRATSFTATGNPNLYTAGRGISITQGGIISTSADDSELYDVGIDQQVPYFVTDSMETAVTIPGTAGYRYLLHSFIVTNISSTESIFNCNIESEGNTYVFANAYTIPYGYSVDIVGDKPSVLLPNTLIKMQAAANDTISTCIVYKSIDDTSYDTTFTTIDQPDTFRTIYEADQSAAIVEGIKILNHSNAILRGTAILTDSSDNLKAYIAANTLLAKNYYSELIINPLRLLLGDKLKFANFGGEANGMTAYVSSRLGEVYNISANTTTVNEGDLIEFTVSTLNVTSGTVRYYRTTGNVTTSDFVGGNTGSFTIVDNSASFIVKAAEDSSPGSEGEEVFQMQILSGSTSGPVLKTSDDVVLIKDTSNSAGVGSLTVSSNLIYESEAIVLTVNALNAEGNNAATFYYTITGNADIYSSTSGAIIINDNTANLEIITEASVPSDEVRSFAIQVRAGSVSGTILDTSDNIYVRPVEEISMTATGGTVTEIEV